MSRFTMTFLVTIAATLSAANVAAAASNSGFIYRYKQELASPLAEVPITSATPCPEPSGKYGASFVSRIAEGCLYNDPVVRVISTDLPVKSGTIEAENYCSNVYSGSNPVDYRISTDQSLAAQYIGDWEASTVNLNSLKSTVCGLGDTVAIEKPEVDPTLSISDLLNADFECKSKTTRCNWSQVGSGNNTGNADYPDKQIGGERTIAPYGSWSDMVFYQDITLGDGFSGITFPVSVESLHSGYVNDRKSAVEIRYLDASKNDIGGFSQPEISPPARDVWVINEASDVAPEGVKYLRVLVKVIGQYSYVDNVSVVVNGKKVSRINGGYGMPIRPRDIVLNAGAEQGSSHWVKNENVSYTDSVWRVTDPLNLIGSLTWSNEAHGDSVMSQQVWLADNQKNKPISVEWMQATGFQESGNIGAPGFVSVKFYKKDGTLISTLGSAPSHFRNAGFFFNEKIEGNVPSNADFMRIIQTMVGSFGKREYLDNILVKIEGKSISAINGNTPDDFNLCPHYVNTISGPADNPWWVDGLTTRNNIRIDPQHDGWRTNQYKSYCVPTGSNSNYLVADYDLKTFRAWGGYSYIGYDENGQEVFSTDRWHQSNSSDTANQIWDVIPIPSDVRYLKTQLIHDADMYTSSTAYNHGSNFSRVVETSNINFIMNGALPTPPDSSTYLYNTKANMGTEYWVDMLRSPGKKAVKTVQIPNGIPATSGTVTGGRSTSSYTGQPGNNWQLDYYTENYFVTEREEGEVYQDVLVSRYNFAPGTVVSLDWRQYSNPIGSMTSAVSGTGETTYTTIGVDPATAGDFSEFDDYKGGMGLEFYDINDKLLYKEPIIMTFGASYLVRGSELHTNATIPEGTWKIRVIMKTAAANNAGFDDIVLRVGGTLLNN